MKKTETRRKKLYCLAWICKKTAIYSRFMQGKGRKKQFLCRLATCNASASDLLRANSWFVGSRVATCFHQAEAVRRRLEPLVFSGLNVRFYVNGCAIGNCCSPALKFSGTCRARRKETILGRFEIHFVKMSMPCPGGFSTGGCGIIPQWVECFYRCGVAACASFWNAMMDCMGWIRRSYDFKCRKFGKMALSLHHQWSE